MPAHADSLPDRRSLMGEVAARSAWSPLRRQAEWVILATTFTANLGVQYLSPLLPAMRAGLHLDTVQVGWIVGAYSLPALVVTIPLGVVADLWGAKRVLVGCLLGFGLTGLGMLTAADFAQLLVWRVLQGIFFAPIASLTISMVAESLPRHEQALAQSYRNVVGSGAEFVQPVLASAILVAFGSWQPAVLLFAAPILVAVWAALALPESENRRRLHERRSYVGDAVTTMVEPAVLAVTVGGFARWFLKYAFFAYMPLYLAGVAHVPVGTIGLVIGIPGLVGALVASQAGRLGLDRAGKVGLAVSLAVLGLSIPAVTLVPVAAWAVAMAVVQGVADGVCGPLLNSFISFLPRESVRVTVVSASGFLRNIGKAAAPAAMGPLVLMLGYPAAFLIMGATALTAPFYLVPLYRSKR
jgi:MFS family permease